MMLKKTSIKKWMVLGVLMPVVQTMADIQPSSTSFATKNNQTQNLNQELSRVRKDVVIYQKKLMDSLQGQKEAKDNLRKIKELMNLQKREMQLGKMRIREIQNTLNELENRKSHILVRVEQERGLVRKSLSQYQALLSRVPRTPQALEQEKFEQPKIRVLQNLTRLGIRQIETLRVDLEDVDRLELKIAEERSQLEAMVQELAESEGILEINKQLQMDLFKKNYQERLAQLEKYRKLKSAESHVGDLIQQFNIRQELQEAQHQERVVQKNLFDLTRTAFAKMKGKLEFPIIGKIKTKFGKTFDADSKLTIFKKGIEIEAGQKQPVRSIFGGTVAYAGELPQLGKVVIVNHGDHFYTICGNLGDIQTKAGDKIQQGSELGLTHTAGLPLYFEIRLRNIPVDPLQWTKPSINL